MRKKIILACIILLVSGMIAGCQESPDEDIVVNKNDDDAAETQSESTERDVNGDTSFKQINDEFLCLNDPSVNQVKFEVDVSVEIVDKNMPIIRMQPHQIQPNEVKHWAEILFGDVPVYEPVTELSKSEIEKEILKYKQLADEDALYEEYGNDEDVQGMLQYYQSKIEYLEKEYTNAPINIERKETDWTFHPSEYYYVDSEYWSDQTDEYDYLVKTYRMEIVSLDDPTGHFPTITATNRDESDYKVNSLWYYYLDERNMNDLPYCQLSEEDAVSMANSKLEELELDGWALNRVEKMDENDVCRYCLTYTPVYSDIPVLACSPVDLKSEDAYAANYDYSELEVILYNGIIQSVCLDSPLDIVETVDENAKLLSFDKIYENFQSQMKMIYSDEGFIENYIGDADAEVIIKVSDIKLGLFRIKEKNTDATFLITPTWGFTGELYVNGENWEEIELCYINAINGSMINTQLGY